MVLGGGGGGWSGGAKVLGKLPVPGRRTNLDYSRARAYCACSRCGWCCLDIFSLVYPFSFLSPSLWETARYRLKYCLKGPLSPKTTNQPTKRWCWMKFRCRGVLLIWVRVGQVPAALAVDAGGGCLDIFSLVHHFFSFSLSRADPI